MSLLFVKKFLVFGLFLLMAFSFVPPIYAAEPSDSASYYNLQWCNVSIPNHNCTRNDTAIIVGDSPCLNTLGPTPISEDAHFGCYGTTTPAKDSIQPLAFTALAPIPGIDYGGTLSGFFTSLYNWGIGIVGVLALGQLIIAGLQYMGSGAVDTKSEAKKRIVDALVGLLLAISSILILNVVNPQTTTITELSPSEILKELEAEKKAREEAAKEEEPLPEPTEATVARCMTSPQLQNFIDNDYNCTEATPPSPCPYSDGEPQNYFSCVAP